MTRVTELDIVFLSYDEPEADALFGHLKSRSPRSALRVHGVKGFDAAHKAAAALAQTERFITVDGDNLVRREFFDQEIHPGVQEPADVVYSFTAQNTINKLAYGNGGIKIWPRDLVLSVDTHEKANGNDFCWTYRYWQRNEVTSDVILQSPYHAFRAGYREAVKLSLIVNQKLPWKTTLDTMYPPNLSRLIVWASVGEDARFGDYAILGARSGLCHVWVDELDPSLINDYDWFKTVWEKVKHLTLPMEVFGHSASLGVKLKHKLGLDLPRLDKMASHWVKVMIANGVNVPREGMMLPSMKPPI